MSTFLADLNSPHGKGWGWGWGWGWGQHSRAMIGGIVLLIVIAAALLAVYVPNGGAILLVALGSLLAIFVLIVRPSVVPILAIASLPVRLSLGRIAGIDLRLADVVFSTAFLCVLLQIVIQHGHRRPAREWKIMLWFLLWSTLSLLMSAMHFGRFTTESITEYARFLISIMGALCVSLLVTDEKLMESLLWIWTIAAAVYTVVNAYNLIWGGELGLYYVQSQLSLSDYRYLRNTTAGDFQDTNALGAYMVLSLFIAVYKVQRCYALKSGFWQRFFALCIVLITLCGVVLTLSRGAWLGLAVGMLLLLRMNKREGRLRRLMVLLLIPLAGLAILIWPIINGFVFNLVSDSSVTDRIPLMMAGFQEFLHYPVFGLGPGNFAVEAGRFVYNPATHNLFLQLAAELGLLGLVFFCMFCLQLVRAGVKFAGNLGRSSKYATGIKSLYPLLLCGLAAYLTQSLTVSFFSAKFFWLYAALMLSVAQLARTESPSQSSLCPTSPLTYL